MSGDRPRGGGPPAVAGTLGGLAALTLVLAVAAAIALAVGPDRPRWPEAVGFAAAVAWSGAAAAWLAGRLAAADPARAVAAVLASTALRTFPPLVGLAWLGAAGRELRAAGADGLLVVFYLLLLATSIAVTMMGSRGSRSPTAGSGRVPPASG